MKDNGNFTFFANHTGKFSSLMTSRQTLLYELERLVAMLYKCRLLLINKISVDCLNLILYSA